MTDPVETAAYRRGFARAKAAISAARRYRPRCIGRCRRVATDISGLCRTCIESKRATASGDLPKPGGGRSIRHGDRSGRGVG
jgi:hypothetical protein